MLKAAVKVSLPISVLYFVHIVWLWTTVIKVICAQTSKVSKVQGNCLQELSQEWGFGKANMIILADHRIS